MVAVCSCQLVVVQEKRVDAYMIWRWISIFNLNVVSPCPFTSYPLLSSFTSVVSSFALDLSIRFFYFLFLELYSCVDCLLHATLACYCCYCC